MTQGEPALGVVPHADVKASGGHDLIAERREFFKSLGATATDHAVVEPFTQRLTPNAAEALFQRAFHRELQVAP